MEQTVVDLLEHYIYIFGTVLEHKCKVEEDVFGILMPWPCIFIKKFSESMELASKHVNFNVHKRIVPNKVSVAATDLVAFNFRVEDLVCSSSKGIDWSA